MVGLMELVALMAGRPDGVTLLEMKRKVGLFRNHLPGRPAGGKGPTLSLQLTPFSLVSSRPHLFKRQGEGV